LQGLFFKNPETLPSFFAPIKDLLQSLHTIAQENNLPLQTLCLQFAIQTQGIDKVVIGVDSSAQLDENLNSLKNSALSSQVFQTLLDSFQNIPTHFINPSQWK
jgi:aryl-alcohol dehydrogenase-like predicted oxidoreductase